VRQMYDPIAAVAAAAGACACACAAAGAAAGAAGAGAMPGAGTVGHQHQLQVDLARTAGSTGHQAWQPRRLTIANGRGTFRREVLECV
jgi:hypothetical protein